MDNVLKRRLIGASILIALAVIFLPVLLVDPDAVDGRQAADVDVPPMPDSAREVRRIPLDPETARIRRPDGDRGDGRSAQAGSSATQRDSGESEWLPRDGASPDESDEIVLRPELARPEQPPAEESDAGEAEARPSAPVESQQQMPLAEAGRPESGAEPETGPQPAVEPDAAPQSEVSPGDWLVQVASFGSQQAAEQVRERLDSLGHSVIREEIVRGQALLYRLSAGPYASREAAEEARMQIAATVGGVEPIVREIDQDSTRLDGDGFAVQTGSFVSKQNADNETARLDELGFDAFRFSEQAGGRTIWRVLVGPVEDREQAERLKKKLDEQANVEGLVVSHP